MDTHPLGDHVATRCDFFGSLCVVAILLLRPSQPNPVPRVQFLALCICNQHKESAFPKEEDTKYHEIVSYILNFQYLIDIQIYLLRNVASCFLVHFVCLFVSFVMLRCPKPCHRTLGTIGKPSMSRPGGALRRVF